MARSRRTQQNRREYQAPVAGQATPGAPPPASEARARMVRSSTVNSGSGSSPRPEVAAASFPASPRASAGGSERKRPRLPCGTACAMCRSRCVRRQATAAAPGGGSPGAVASEASAPSNSSHPYAISRPKW